MGLSMNYSLTTDTGKRSPHFYRKGSASKAMKMIAVATIALMITITWNSTVPTVKAEDDPEAKLGFITSYPIETLILDGFGTPFWTDVDGDGSTNSEVIAYKLGSGDLYCAVLTQDAGEPAHYEWKVLIEDIPSSFSITRGDEEDWIPDGIVPFFTNLNDVNNPNEDLILTNSRGMPKWFKITETINPDTNLPEFEYMGDLNIFIEGHASTFCDITGDKRPDLITTDYNNYLIYYENLDDGGFPQFAGPNYMLDDNGDKISFNEELEIVPYLAPYGDTSDPDLFITTGTMPLMFFENTAVGDETRWVEQPVDGFLGTGAGLNKHMQLIDFNAEMYAILGGRF